MHEAYIDKCIEYYFDDPLFDATEVGEKLGEKKDLLKSVFKMSYLRGVLQTNNLVPPQFQMLHGNVDEDQRVDAFIDSENIAKNASALLIEHEDSVARLRARNDKVVTGIEERAEATSGGGGNDDDNNDPDPEPSNDDTPSDDNNPESTDGGGGQEEDALFGEGGGADNPLG